MRKSALVQQKCRLVQSLHDLELSQRELSRDLANQPSGVVTRANTLIPPSLGQCSRSARGSLLKYHCRAEGGAPLHANPIDRNAYHPPGTLDLRNPC